MKKATGKRVASVPVASTEGVAASPHGTPGTLGPICRTWAHAAACALGQTPTNRCRGVSSIMQHVKLRLSICRFHNPQA